MDKRFEDARIATEEMFNEEAMPEETENEQETPEDTAQPEETPTEGEQSEQQMEEEIPKELQMMEEATRTAEQAAQTAAQKNAELQQALQQLEAMKQQNLQLQGTIDELSKKNEEKIIEEALEPPFLDVNALAFADEETVKKAQADYAMKMTEYNKNQIMKELAPFMEQAKAGLHEKEKNEVLSVLKEIPELRGIEEILPQVERIIANNKALFSDDIPMDEKYITAYAMAKGANNITMPPEAPKELTPEELMDLYNKNPAFQELVEKQRISQIKDSQQVPPLTASSGAVNAALNIKEKPKTFDEASERTRKMFGL